MSKKKLLAMQKQDEHILKNKMVLKDIKPMTKKQADLFEIYNRDIDGLSAIGSAGTGKTMCALYLALKDVIEDNLYDKIIIVRTAVQTRDQGFLPGKLSEKMEQYETPYIDIVNDLYDRSDAYKLLKDKGYIEFMSSSFVRGLTFNNAIIIFDECQNANYQEMRSVITRVGENSRIIFCGDTKQDDLQASKNKNDKSGLASFLNVLRNIDGGFPVVEFSKEDIVRSGLVKKFIIAEEEMCAY